MGCEVYQELISRLLDEDLSPDEQRALQEHLKNCSECAALYRAFRAVSNAAGQDLEDPPERLHYNVMAAIRREEIRKKNRLSRPVKAILTAAACLALLIGVSAGAGVFRPKGAAGPASTMMASTNQLVRSAPAAASGSAAEEAAAEEAVADMTEVPAQAAAPMMLNLADRLSLQDLTAFLGGADTALTVDPPATAPLAVITVADGETTKDLSFYQDGDSLLYTWPEGGIHCAACSWEALASFLNLSE